MPGGIMPKRCGRAGERELAVQHLLQALAQAPDDAAVAVRAGEMQLALGQVDDARRMANRVLDLDPNDGGAWALRGRVKECERENSKGRWRI